MNAFVILACTLAAATAAPTNLLATPLAAAGPVIPVAAGPGIGGVSVRAIGQGPTQLVRAPAHDSASIEHHRLGGNFAYATAEAHAYAHITPQISEATFPVAETTFVSQGPAIATVIPAKIQKTITAHRPVLAKEAVIGSKPVIGPVSSQTFVEQPIVKQEIHTVTQPITYQKTGLITTQKVIAQPAIAAQVVAEPALAYGKNIAAVNAIGAIPSQVGVGHAKLGLAAY